MLFVTLTDFQSDQVEPLSVLIWYCNSLIPLVASSPVIVTFIFSVYQPFAPILVVIFELTVGFSVSNFKVSFEVSSGDLLLPPSILLTLNFILLLLLLIVNIGLFKLVISSHVSGSFPSTMILYSYFDIPVPSSVPLNLTWIWFVYHPSTLLKIS